MNVFGSTAPLNPFVPNDELLSNGIFSAPEVEYDAIDTENVPKVPTAQEIFAHNMRQKGILEAKQKLRKTEKSDPMREELIEDLASLLYKDLIAEELRNVIHGVHQLRFRLPPQIDVENLNTPVGLDIHGQSIMTVTSNAIVNCPCCLKQVVAGRFAPHFEVCYSVSRKKDANKAKSGNPAGTTTAVDTSVSHGNSNDRMRARERGVGAVGVNKSYENRLLAPVGMSESRVRLSIDAKLNNLSTQAMPDVITVNLLQHNPSVQRALERNINTSHASLSVGSSHKQRDFSADKKKKRKKSISEPMEESESGRHHDRKYHQGFGAGRSDNIAAVSGGSVGLNFSTIGGISATVSLSPRKKSRKKSMSEGGSMKSVRSGESVSGRAKRIAEIEANADSKWRHALDKIRSMPLLELRSLLDARCGVVSQSTLKMCTKSKKCPVHTDEDREIIRLLLLPEKVAWRDLAKRKNSNTGSRNSTSSRSNTNSRISQNSMRNSSWNTSNSGSQWKPGGRRSKTSTLSGASLGPHFDKRISGRPVSQGNSVIYGGGLPDEDGVFPEDAGDHDSDQSQSQSRSSTRSNSSRFSSQAASRLSYFEDIQGVNSSVAQVSSSHLLSNMNTASSVQERFSGVATTMNSGFVPLVPPNSFHMEYGDLYGLNEHGHNENENHFLNSDGFADSGRENAHGQFGNHFSNNPNSKNSGRFNDSRMGRTSTSGVHANISPTGSRGGSNRFALDQPQDGEHGIEILQDLVHGVIIEDMPSPFDNDSEDLLLNDDQMAPRWTLGDD